MIAGARLRTVRPRHPVKLKSPQARMRRRLGPHVLAGNAEHRGDCVVPECAYRLLMRSAGAGHLDVAVEEFITARTDAILGQGVPPDQKLPEKRRSSVAARARTSSQPHPFVMASLRSPTDVFRDVRKFSGPAVMAALAAHRQHARAEDAEC